VAKEEDKAKKVDEQRTEKVQHNQEVYNKMKEVGTGAIGELYVDNHYVERCN